MSGTWLDMWTEQASPKRDKNALMLYDLFQNYWSKYMIDKINFSFATFLFLESSTIRFFYTLDPDPGSAIFRQIPILNTEHQLTLDY